MRLSSPDVAIICLAIPFTFGVLDQITGFFFGAHFIPYPFPWITSFSMWAFPPALALYAWYGLKKRGKVEGA